MAVELATGYVTIIPDTSRVARDLGRAFDQAGSAAGQQGGKAAGGGIADALGSLGGKAGPIGAALGSVFALAGVSVGGLFVKAMQKGMEREKVLDTAQARLGADDATMQKIGQAAGRAYVGAFGTSVEENISTATLAMQSGLIDTNATAQEIEAVISQLTGLNDFIDGDLTETTKAASIMLSSGLVGSSEHAFDTIAAGYRALGPQGDDLIDSLKEYSSGWVNTGLDAEQAIALIGQSIDLGADSTDRAADALREFGRRVTEEGDTIVETLDGIGLNGTEMYDAFKRGGPDAFKAFDKAFDTIRAIEDPVERNAAAMALLGDTAGDFIGALAQWDPSAAMEKLGNVGGAAEDVLNTMSGNAATSVESAKRSIEVATDEISVALAGAFGPHLAKLADWVSTHQPEILGFLGKVVDGAFAVGDALLTMTTMGLRHLANFVDGAGPLIGALLKPMGWVSEAFGKLTGNKDLENFGRSVQNLETTFDGVSTKARELADGIDRTARPAFDRMRNSVADNITEAVNAEQMMRALGETVTSLPDGHTIVLQDNTPETTQRLEALGLKVTELPDGQVTVTADTTQGQQILDDFVTRNYGKQIPVSILASLSAESQRLADAAANSGNQTYSQGYVRYAAGGIAQAGPAAIRDRVVNQWAEAGPEAYIPLSRSRRDRSIPIWMEAGRRLGMLNQFADGGIAGKRATSWAQSKNGLPYIYGPQDCSWYMSGIYNQLTGENVRFTTASDLSAYGFVRGTDPYGFTIGNDGGNGTGGHMAGRLLGTPVETDGSNGVQYGGSADGPEGFPEQWYLPRDLWSPPATDDTSLGSGGAAPSGQGGSSSGGSGSTGTGSRTFNGVSVPDGVTPVWIVGGGLSSGAAVEPASADTYAPQSSSTTAQPAEMPDPLARAGQAGGDFLKSNADQLLSDLGLRSSGGSVQAFVSTLLDVVAQQAQSEVARQVKKQERGLVKHAVRPY